ncbi:MAG TPA: ABC transporter ATP-binding protein [Ilumatobacteraceae bacterium]|nr:ABC transporter ATP-binding protein [Ilumatobacteraceae bacterium]
MNPIDVDPSFPARDRRDSRGRVAVCTGLRRSFGDRLAVDDVSFSIAPGETYGLLGPNGAGKTTTISMLCGVLQAEAGTVEVAGRPVSPGHPEARGAIGYVPQDLALYPDLTARENLRFFGRLQGLRARWLDERIGAVLEVVGLVDRADDRIESYSGGMKRRANIAVGLLHEPQLLVLDEPTVGVDPQSRTAILDAVDTLGGEGLAVLYTTHYMEEAARLCDRIGIIDEGRLVAEGTRRELIDRLGSASHVRIEAVGMLDAFANAVRELPMVRSVSTSDGVVDVTVDDGRRSIAALVEAAERSGVEVAGVEVIEPDLEAVFLHMTGKALRD